MSVFLYCSPTSTSKNNRSFDTPVKGPPQGPRLHIDIPRVQLLIEDKEGIKQIGEMKRKRAAALWVTLGFFVFRRRGNTKRALFSFSGEDKATIPVTDTEFNQTGNPQSFCTGVSVHHPALIQNTGPLIDMSDIRPGTSKCNRQASTQEAENPAWLPHNVNVHLVEGSSTHYPYRTITPKCSMLGVN